MSLKNKKILIMANAAISKGDYEGFLSFCTEDTEWTFVGEQTLKGKEAVRKYMSSEYLEAPKFIVKNLIADGEFVIALGQINLKDENGASMLHSYCDVWRFRDGKMFELNAFVI